MKSITVKMLAALTTVALVGLFAQSSFAAKAMSDSELDATTAKGQSAISVGSGDQIIVDHSEYELKVKDAAQQEITAGVIANVAGENNVAAAINTADGATISQNNTIKQDKSELQGRPIVHGGSVGPVSGVKHQVVHRLTGRSRGSVKRGEQVVQRLAERKLVVQPDDRSGHDHDHWHGCWQCERDLDGECHSGQYDDGHWRCE